MTFLEYLHNVDFEDDLELLTGCRNEYWPDVWTRSALTDGRSVYWDPAAEYFTTCEAPAENHVVALCRI